ncbi:DnaJ domain-containing protein [Plectosphaerella plurivora]|uniref:DnaJ domain-containing protein n=1 Tax=Plectosphaerella plurivora TaxID=936078 RepID=A0A9P8VH34_9PEZI|nr:DnaJ domain-containing protein [Plectosphaerella plurivora]
MKSLTMLIGLLGLMTTLAAAWSKEDREIFRIRDEIVAHQENPQASFYELLGVSQKASIDDITKAYRKITRSLHPDKVKQQLKAERNKLKKEGKAVKPPTQKEISAAVKTASDRQTRLGLVRKILSGPDRDRYDHFLRHGFPAWKGTNYYYDRYRPGFGTAVFGVFAFIGGAIHYLVLVMNHKKHRDFIERYIKFARDQAWGDNLSIPGVDSAPKPVVAEEEEEESPAAMPVNRRQRRLQEAAARKDKGIKGKKNAGSGTATPKEAAPQQAAPTGPRKRVIAENGKVLVVDLAGNVYLEEQDEEGNLETFLLDLNELKAPTFTDTAVVRLPLWVFNSTVGRFLGGKASSTEDLDDLEVDSDNDVVHHTPSGSTDSAAEDFELLEGSTDSLGKAKSSGAQAAAARANRRKNKKR